MRNFNIFLIFFVLSSCLSKQKDGELKSNISTPIKYINIFMENDTLSKNEEIGKVSLFYKLNDTR